MNNIKDSKFALTSKFGLNLNQAKILFSIQKLIVENDIAVSRMKHSEKSSYKEKWLKEWSKSILDYLCELESSQTRSFYNRYEIKQAINSEVKKSPSNNSWYYIIMLECISFIPYKCEYIEDKKNCIKSSSSTKIEFIKKLVREHMIINVNDIDKLEEAYNKTITKLKGGLPKIIIAMVGILSMTFLINALRSIYLGPVLIAIFGARANELVFMKAYLAAVTGGVISVGNIREDDSMIVGGGVLLGLARDEHINCKITRFIAIEPRYTLMQTAKLEVVLKEIILKSSKDIIVAKEILSNYKEQIGQLHMHVLQLTTENDIEFTRKLRKSLYYMEKSYKDMNLFILNFEKSI